MTTSLIHPLQGFFRDELDMSWGPVSWSIRNSTLFEMKCGVDDIGKVGTSVLKNGQRLFSTFRITEHGRVPVYHVGDSPLPDDLPTSTNTRSPACLEVARQWLSACVREHGECRHESGPEWVRTRLVDVGSPSTGVEPRLCLREEVWPGSGCLTLSHCWGGKLTFTLTAASLGEFRRAIAASALPKTYLKAMRVARFLGHRYLWIDSLCIVQDSSEDWIRECSTMGLVYQKGVCNIAASDSTDGSGVCFFARPPNCFDPVVVVSRTLRSTRRHSCCNVRYEFRGRANIRSLDSAPLYKLVWVLQEWVLSPRMLHFSKNNISWECRRGSASKIHPSIDPERSVIGDLPKPRLDKLDLDSLMMQWIDMVEVYSQTWLTRGEDKLPAFSGIAKMFLPLLQSFEPEMEYLVGVWSRHLVPQLLWNVDDDMPNSKLGRPSGFRAPSWSWASLERCIVFSIKEELGSQQSILIDFGGSSVSPTGTDLFQEVTGGYIRMTCLLWKLGRQHLANPYENGDTALLQLLRLTLHRLHIREPDEEDYGERVEYQLPLRTRNSPAYSTATTLPSFDVMYLFAG